jgi:hypothetical protein
MACLGAGAIWADAALAEPFLENSASNTILDASSTLDLITTAPLSSYQPPTALLIEVGFEPEAMSEDVIEKEIRFRDEKISRFDTIVPFLPASVSPLPLQPLSHSAPIAEQPLQSNTSPGREVIDVALSADFVTEATALEFSELDNGEAPSFVFGANEEPDILSQTADGASEIPWRFVLEPYLYLPLATNGDVTVRNVEVPFDFGLGDILESLTFAFYGRFEAWKGPWAFIFDGYYFNTVESESRSIPTSVLPPGLLPPQITQVSVGATAETAFFKLDFAGAYRFGDGNLANAFSTAETEFDLGPFVFDAIAGLRLYSFSNDIELTSNIGVGREFGSSNTFVEPMIGGRARWNFSDHLAAIVAANVSGFGIGTDISVEGYAGIDWLFSGNTSLTAMYRLTYIDYTQGSSGFNLFQHGPAIGVKFRF